MFKKIRIGILLLVLLSVVLSNYRSQVNSVSWKYTLMVHVYPINGDGSIAASKTIANLKIEDFQAIETFMKASAQEYGRTSSASIEMKLQPSLQKKPPLPPETGNVFEVMLWSLQFRWWAYRHADVVGPGPQVRLFVQYFDPKTSTVHHSTALQKGLIGQVNVFAGEDSHQQNNVVIAHELLHTLGATDKYQFVDNQPIYPDGFAEPQLSPSYPQSKAEIMGGRIPITPQQSHMPNSLKEVVIGKKTAQEINFIIQE